MTPQVEQLANKYAIAYMRVFGFRINDEVIARIDDLVAVCDEHREQFFYLYLESIDREIKKKLLLQLFERFNLHTILEPLIQLLAMQRRLPLFIDILRQLHVVYQTSRDIVDVQFMSAQQLSAEQQKVLVQFLHAMTGKNIRPKLIINPTLIAGVRLQSDTFLWEHSVAQQLQRIKALA